MPDTDVIAYRKAVEFFHQGRHLEALALFREAATTGEDRPMEHFALAAAYMKTGQHAEARAEYERYFALGGAGPEQDVAARTMMKKLGAAPRATARRKKPGTAPAAPAPGPDLAVIRRQFDEGVAYCRAGGFQAALERLEPLLAGYGRTPELLNVVAACRVGLGEDDRALALLEEAVTQPGCPPEVLVSLGRLHFDRGCRTALAALTAAVEQAPDHVVALYNKGVVHFATGDYEAAERTWRKALFLEPGDRQLKANLDFLSRRPR